MDAVLSVSNLTKSFGDHLVLDDISFTLKKGETLGIAGESGSGKTTLGRTLLRLIEPDSGSIIFSGIDICKCTASEIRKLRKRMQIIFQNPYSSIDPYERVFDVIRAPLVNASAGRRAEQRKMVQKTLGLVGLPVSAMDKRAGEFSGGERQRIAIARAIITSPDLIIADECVSSLDVSVRAGILRLLLSLQKELGLSYIFISHDLSSLKCMSHWIAVMYHGRFVEIAPSAVLFSEPLHPYTRELLASVLLPETGAREAFRDSGSAEFPSSPFSGCLYAHRCPMRDKCSMRCPQLKEVSPGHSVACNFF